MGLGEKAEELLETLWIRTEEKKEGSLPLDALMVTERKLMEQLFNAGYVSISDNRAKLTSTGRPEAVNVVRRHRLAERLLTDVLGTKDMLVHEKACKFEHLLDRGLDESICVLLGHPKVCPHGNTIPPGRCCREKQAQPQKVVAPLSQLSLGQKGKVAYIYAPETDKLQKMMAMGILPGAPISPIQNFPSHVFQAGQTEFAVDKEIADAIYVRLIEEETADHEEGEPRRELKQQRGKLAWRFGLGRKKGKPK